MIPVWTFYLMGPYRPLLARRGHHEKCTRTYCAQGRNQSACVNQVEMRGPVPPYPLSPPTLKKTHFKATRGLPCPSREYSPTPYAFWVPCFLVSLLTPMSKSHLVLWTVILKRGFVRRGLRSEIFLYYFGAESALIWPRDLIEPRLHSPPWPGGKD